MNIKSNSESLLKNFREEIIGGTYPPQKGAGHPAVFPEQLANDHIVSWSNEGDVVLDPFSGSGTTHKMALLNNRKFIGFEISQEYVDIERKRLEDCGLWRYDY